MLYVEPGSTVVGDIDQGEELDSTVLVAVGGNEGVGSLAVALEEPEDKAHILVVEALLWCKVMAAHTVVEAVEVLESKVGEAQLLKHKHSD